MVQSFPDRGRSSPVRPDGAYGWSVCAAADPPVAVLGRYLGVVGVLADLLTRAGMEVACTWAADDPAAPPRPSVGVLQGSRVVVTLAPGDPTLPDLRRDGLAGPVVAVTWHPDDELGPVPGPAVLLRAGEVLRGLASAVADLPSPPPVAQI